MKRTVYRNKRTGRFVTKAKWKRSRAHGGKRFVRQRVRFGGKKRILRRPIKSLDEMEDLIEESQEEFEDIYLEGAFDS